MNIHIQNVIILCKYIKVVNKIYPKSIEKIEDDRIKDIILKLIGDKESRPSINDIKIYFDEFLY